MCSFNYLFHSEGECLTTPCRNGGTCRHLADNGYRCDCIDPFIGQNCEIGIMCNHSYDNDIRVNFNRAHTPSRDTQGASSWQLREFEDMPTQ